MRTRNLLIFLLLFLSVGALFGGGAFLIFPEGWIEMTPELMLQHSPFKKLSNTRIDFVYSTWFDANFCCMGINKT